MVKYYTFIIFILLFHNLVGQPEKMEVDGAITIGNTQTTNPAEGTIRYNAETKDFEGWNGAYWISFSSGISHGTVSDVDGNTYKTVKIGDQEWMAENLNTRKYRNGDEIPNTISDGGWSSLTSGSYSYYDNLPVTYQDVYGKLYNGYALADERGLCPEGWVVPSFADWTILTNFLGGLTAAYGKLKEIGFEHWEMPNLEATNESGFTARPGGYRDPNGNFSGEGIWAIFGMSNSQFASIHYQNLDLLLFGEIVKYGFSVRCLKD